MSGSTASYALSLLGPFRLFRPGGIRIDIPSKRGQAMIAMLAMAGGGERTRGWLQDRLWGSRAQVQAQASLRREISTLRQAVNGAGPALLMADHSRVWLDLSQLDVDARAERQIGADEFLEGIDIAGEEGFEDWLREERSRAKSGTGTVNAQQDTGDVSSLKPAPVAFSAMPAIAVLPFSNATGDVGNDFLAEGVSEDLIDRLARLRWLPVIARSSSFALKDAGGARAVGAALGARYILDGQLRKALGGFRLSSSLSDSVSGEIVWSNQMDLSEALTRGALDQLLAGVTAVLASRIDQHEQVRAVASHSGETSVDDLIWRGKWHRRQLTKEDGEAAIICFEEALRQEPNSSEAMVQFAWARMELLWAKRATEEEIRQLRQQAQRAIIADYDDARGHMLAGIAEIWLKQPLRAQALLQMAVDLNPSLVMAHEQLGSVKILCGDYDKSIEHLSFAVRLSPNDEKLFFTHAELAMAHLLNGAFEDALHFSDQSIARRAAYWQPHVVKVNALNKLGRMEDAASATADLLAAKPTFEVEHIDWIPFLDRGVIIYLKNGLNLSSR